MALIANALNIGVSEMEPIQKRAVPSSITRRGSDADLVLSTFQEIVRAQQTLCSILIDKANLFRSTGAGGVVGPRVYYALGRFRGAMDDLASDLIKMTVSRAEDLKIEAETLGSSLIDCAESFKRQ
ncbi:hypothetical protein C7999DRAFT_35325 [Corynascus novoguineensis]|uniref:Uncharacterized protein n=1 Tax=Corynascus novoguineensis TaxID=1126955 RepID=A0AAN7HLI1_9PEZI|nr:hypothetical protein C7999DRAFT_35325 [Corynascus novoguineensis]